MTMVADLAALIAKAKGAKFAKVTYRNEEGELARHTLILGASTENLYLKDIAKLEEMLADATVTGIDRAAVEFVLNSRKESLSKGIGNNSAYVHSAENADTYLTVDGLPGIMIHKETGVMYVKALSEDKVVIEAGTPKKAVKSSEQTIARNKVRKALPSARFRQFKLAKIARAAMNGEVLEIDGE